MGSLCRACSARRLHGSALCSAACLAVGVRSLLRRSRGGPGALLWTMGGLQVPGDRLIARFGPRMALTLATFVAAAGYLVMALPWGFASLCIGLVIAGVGSSAQHPRASLLVTDTYGKASRGPLGIYNFAGDLGKATFPAAVALLLPVFAWRPVVAIMSIVGLAVGVVLWALVPRQPFTTPTEDKSAAKRRDGSGFGLLFIIGALDTATRMGYLLFLPFLLHARGAAGAVVGLGLAKALEGITIEQRIYR
jgi:FSR family fosmidomycin resistance protein-like MFS transporter